MIKSFIKLALIVFSIIAILFLYFYFTADRNKIDGNFLINLNKTIALSGVLCILSSLSISTLRKIGLKFKPSFNFFIKHLGLNGFYLASIHIFFSLLLLNSENHPYLFDVDMQLNLSGQMTVLFGAISFGIFLMPAITSVSVIKAGMSKEKWQSIQRLSYFGIGSVSVHLLFIVYERYSFSIDNSVKFNYEPLLISIFIIILLFIRIITMFNQKSSKD